MIHYLYPFVRFASVQTWLADKHAMLAFFAYVSLFTFSPCSRFHVRFVARGRFSLHSIVYDIQVTYKQASDISVSHVFFKMINPANVVKIFADRIEFIAFYRVE
jgi:hypothetical protein